jgi:molecular chaperone GrpE
MAADDAGHSKEKSRAREEKAAPEDHRPEDVEGLDDDRDEVEYMPVAEEPAHVEEPAAKTGARPAVEDEKRLKGKLKQKDAELKAVKAERDELKDKYLRKLAEMENLRKRFDRERQEYMQYALGDFLRELLVVLDNFERALQSRDEADGKSFQEGVEMIHRQYLDLLKRKGVRPIEPKDKGFDPTVQQAVMTEESDAVTEPEVAEELQRGYTLNEKLLRPALVKVLVPKKGGPS